MINKIFEKARDWQIIHEVPTILHVIKDRVKMRPLFLKDSLPPAEFSPHSTNESGIMFHYPPAHEFEEITTLYYTLGRQLEVDFRLDSIEEPGTAWLIPMEARIGKVIRGVERFPNEHAVVMASNFQISKNEVNLEYSSRVSNKIIFSEYERILSKELPGLKIVDPGIRDLPQEVISAMKRGASIYVEDITQTSSYAPSIEGVMDYLTEMEREMVSDRESRRFRDTGIRSFLAVPLLCDLGGETRTPIGCIHLMRKAGVGITRLEFEKVIQSADELVRRVGEANTLHVSERQRIVNFSDKGMALELTNEDLIQTIPGKKRLTFDLVFKKQAPIRLQGSICHIEKVMSNRMLVGIEFDGTTLDVKSSHPLNRLKDLIQLVKIGKIQ